ncbi:MAG: DnaJ domain-containing protein [Clostridia bacterium]|nr:DnaJ domain-containing protein [Clostridia bacterium]
MKNPYEILGVSTDASVEEVKEAYKILSKQYYGNADEYSQGKLKELDDAYDAIIGTFDYGNVTKEIRMHIRNGDLMKAEEMLNGIPNANRNAEWYFLSGNINQKRGYFENASNDFTTAYNMDSNNAEYRAAYENINRRRSANYRTTDPSNNVGCTACDVCQALICADCLCSCCDCC